MRNIIPAKTADASSKENTLEQTSANISIRVSPNSYFNVIFLATFFSGFLFYIEQDLIGIILFIGSWIIFPILAWTDRIVFDGKRLKRTGFLPHFWKWINNERKGLKITDVEQVETQALRALKRGGNVFYRYRTLIQGRNINFAIASGGEDYRRMIHSLFPLLPENTLDTRSIELRDYLSEPKETLMKAEFAKIPSAEVLENSLKTLQKGRKRIHSKYEDEAIGDDEMEKIAYLRQLGNELRLSGYLIQALEAFRRALILNPGDARLIFEFARCLHSFAGSERDPKLQKKAFAAMRLAEKRGKDDPKFLGLLGESYFQYGDWDRAYRVFQKALDAAEGGFRSVRGLAEIALREGKIAHVIHHFGSAYHLAETTALRRWTKSEREYFARLNSDEDYMEMEISRVNMLEGLENSKKTSLRIAILGLPFIVIGLILEAQLMTNIGWAVSSVALLIWAGLIMSRNLLSGRLPLEVSEED